MEAKYYYGLLEKVRIYIKIDKSIKLLSWLSCYLLRDCCKIKMLFLAQIRQSNLAKLN